MRWQFTLLVSLLIALSFVASPIKASTVDDDDDFETDDIVVGENVKIKVAGGADADAPEPLPAATIEYQSPYPTPGKFYMAEHFDDLGTFEKRWIRSQAKKDDISEEIAKYDGEWQLELPSRPLLSNDMGLVLKSKAKHAAISARLNKPFVFADKTLVVQYEVTLQDGQECGGSYIKLLSSGKETTDLTKFNDKTPYTIMFGPDKCGNDIKLHFIFRHVNPKNGTITEKHCKKPKERLEEPFKDKQPHLYQLLIRPDNSFEIRVDHKLVNEGSLLTHFEPPVNPPREIDDPNDVKPADWDEREKIADPDAIKPEDWNEDEPPQIPDPSASKPENWLDEEEEMIPDPAAIMPEDWDTEIDGEWEAPLIPNPVCEAAVGCGLWQVPLISNPQYKGKWRAPLIENPNYQGKWAPKKIPNPDFYEDLQPFRMATIAAVGIELWSMSSDILFDNLLITHDVHAADEWASQTFDLKKQQLDKEAVTLWDRAMKYMNYKPGWWAVYFIYCMIPISLYGWYLSRRVSEEESLITRLIKYTNEKPWMWGVYVVVVGLPMAIALFLLCSKKEKPEQLHPKKTDMTTADDDEVADDDQEEETAAAGGDDVSKGRSSRTRPNNKPSKSDLDSKPMIVEEDAAVAEPDSDDDVNDNEQQAAGEPGDVQEVDSVESVDKPEADQRKKDVRKRKPRKE